MRLKFDPSAGRLYRRHDRAAVACDPGSPSPAATLDQAQRAAFLEQVHQGAGRLTACVALGIRPSALRRTLATRPGFRRAVAMMERLRAERLRTVLYAAALRGDARAAMFLLARRGSTPRGRRRRAAGL
jgi:hypothetical protein